LGKIEAEDVLVCSTGRIQANADAKYRAGNRAFCSGQIVMNGRDVAEAIMTTDTRRKEIAFEFKVGRSTVRIGGICKGAGMIQPGMATMLAFITTDAAIEPATLKSALKIAVQQSFNRITVDGDMSTNDSVIALANGLAGNRKSEIRNSKFQDALNLVCLELAKMIVRDGEGTSRFITLRVCGARSPIARWCAQAGAAATQTGDGFSVRSVIRRPMSMKRLSMLVTRAPAAKKLFFHFDAGIRQMSP
jgi:glutamate N-acetyltransferase/amino-acid N-acetyltransferase